MCHLWGALTSSIFIYIVDTVYNSSDTNHIVLLCYCSNAENVYNNNLQVLQKLTDRADLNASKLQNLINNKRPHFHFQF